MKSNKLIFNCINTIPNPVIITNGIELLISNNDFLNFFDCVNVEEFVSKHTCVCNLFLNHPNYFSLSKLDQGILWTEHLNKSDNDISIVSILDMNKKPKVFEITINQPQQYENHYIVVFTDITAVQNENTLLEKLAYIDPLTNIYNRQMFDQLLLKEKENKKRYGDNLSLIMLDIDYFKAVNDNYGHNIGDKTLITLTKLITKHLRVSDIFARWGGEEFMILLPRTNIDTAYDKAEELRGLIENYKDTGIPKITVSFGVTEILDKDKKQSTFIRVDKALYRAKIKRNNVAIY
ncbi:MAG: two-component system cell cycle response regulator [Sulfurimonas sp.]|jgi:two-component system cell cycle response regulator|uniref:GGDEF domain-containing protein n=1 Tax=Sulfurimonas sp. TaxID=2022749 RepID=UPI0039E5858D